jgi:ribose/xylose/arabinose/galactoside ABC-type transport system permease subunit
MDNVAAQPTAAQRARASAERHIALGFQQHSRNLGLLAALLVVLLMIGLFAPRYLTVGNLTVVSLQVFTTGILALGSTFVLATGNVDLSIGSIFSFTAVASALLAAHGVPWPLAMLGGIAAAGLIGLINGALVLRANVSPVIVTLGSLSVVKGLVIAWFGAYAVVGVPVDFKLLGQARPFGIPVPVLVFLATAVIAWLTLAKTNVGRHILAIGGNREAAAAAGIDVRRTVLYTFLVNGCVVGLAAALSASRFGTASADFGNGFEFDVLTAVILGGVSFLGGEATIVGVFIAVVLLAVINSGLAALGVDVYWVTVVKGSALIIAVLLDQVSHERREYLRKLLAMRDRAPA